MVDIATGTWWCEKCKDELDLMQVTHEENHVGCGCPVIWIDNSTKTYAYLEAELAKVQAEIKRLTTHLENVNAVLDATASQVRRLQRLGYKANKEIERLRGALEPFAAGCRRLIDLNALLRPAYEREVEGYIKVAGEALAQDKPARYGGPGCGPCNERFDQPISSKGIKKALADAGVKPKCGTCGGRRLSPPLVCPECQGEAKVCEWWSGGDIDEGNLTWNNSHEKNVPRLTLEGPGDYCHHCGLPVKVRE